MCKDFCPTKTIFWVTGSYGFKFWIMGIWEIHFILGYNINMDITLTSSLLVIRLKEYSTNIFLKQLLFFFFIILLLCSVKRSYSMKFAVKFSDLGYHPQIFKAAGLHKWFGILHWNFIFCFISCILLNYLFHKYKFMGIHFILYDLCMHFM